VEMHFAKRLVLSDKRLAQIDLCAMAGDGRLPLGMRLQGGSDVDESVRADAVLCVEKLLDRVCFACCDPALEEIVCNARVLLPLTSKWRDDAPSRGVVLSTVLYVVHLHLVQSRADMWNYEALVALARDLPDDTEVLVRHGTEVIGLRWALCGRVFKEHPDRVFVELQNVAIGVAPLLAKVELFADALDGVTKVDNVSVWKGGETRARLGQEAHGVQHSPSATLPTVLNVTTNARPWIIDVCFVIGVPAIMPALRARRNSAWGM